MHLTIVFGTLHRSYLILEVVVAGIGMMASGGQVYMDPNETQYDRINQHTTRLRSIS